MENNWASSGLEAVKNSQLIRVLLIGFLIVLLQIPIGMIQTIISEREETRNETTEEVTAKWGREQSVVGPFIVVPYVKKWSETRKDGEPQIHTEVRYADFLPENLHIFGKIDSEVRYRGIFEIPVYRMSLTVIGRFAQPDFSEWGIDSEDILWDRAYLSICISDARTITNQPILTWNKHKLSFMPGSGESSEGKTEIRAGLKTHLPRTSDPLPLPVPAPGIHASLKARLDDKHFDFSFPLELNGSMGAFFVPFGQETKVDLKSNWSEPSFQGNWLPSQRTVTNKGFQATWDIPFLGRNYPQKWRSGAGLEKAISLSRFGVNLVSPVDHYRMAHRSVKYEILFLVLTFVTLWLFEILIKIRIHSLQYLLVGAGMCLFYLLELSLAEHIGFVAAYIIASSAIVLLISTYCVAILKSTMRAVVVGTVITLLYGYLYILLRNQDYALLVGSIGLFLVLATVMYLTRKIDWYSLKI
ncbi:MAG: cell envelope integrity protein CreD [bacterium]|nr:cell envelope integrity protein CreD [bacterium]